MAGFLYYAHQWSRPVTPELLDAWGLAYAFEGSVQHAETAGGPAAGGAGRGVVFGELARMTGRRLVARPAPEQEWTLLAPAAEDTPELWVGHWLDAPPSPADLLRRQPMPGHLVELGGQRWTVPLALRWEEHDPPRLTCALPRRVRFDATVQKWTYDEVGARYGRLWEIACDFANAQQAALSELWAAMEAKGDAPQPGEELEWTLSRGDVLTMATEVLRFNYRLGPVEASLISLFEGTDGAAEVLQALVDTPAVERMAQKKTAEASAGSPS